MIKTKLPALTLTTYNSNPGGNYLKINVRSGPGVEFSIIREVNRGDVVFGVDQALDKNGDLWIKLKNGGYAKEVILTKIRPQK